MINIDELRAKHPPKDPDTYHQEYEEVALSFEIARIAYVLRTQAGITQSELARRMGTSQPAIARMESGGHTPSLDMLDRLGHALHLRLRLTAEPAELPAPHNNELAANFGAVAA
ncbi:MAG: XRE family transcriptional regulator [Acidimicrobiales bacterium]|nr:MAG: XRE family transcriptional regulator [Acidimicrobiales bacterium]